MWYSGNTPTLRACLEIRSERIELCAMKTQRRSYSTDLHDAEWHILAPFVLTPRTRGRPREMELREVLNAIFYILRTGSQWRLLPHDFPNWQTVYYYFRQWRKDGRWVRMNDALRRAVRRAASRNAEPSAAILDSQTAKTTEQGGERGYDAGKKINGRKRHILVDTLGLLLMVVVHAANVQDYDGAKFVLNKVRFRLPRLKLIWADSIYTHGVDWVRTQCRWVLEIVKRPAGIKGFQVLPRRWVVERTFGWLGRNRRLSKDYERLPESSETWVYAGMTRLMVRRLARQATA